MSSSSQTKPGLLGLLNKLTCSVKTCAQGNYKVIIIYHERTLDTRYNIYNFHYTYDGAINQSLTTTLRQRASMRESSNVVMAVFEQKIVLVCVAL